MIPHELLLHKLKIYGIGESVVNWIKSYLTERSQSIRVGSTFSHPQPVPAGVPQGSHLGPLLFAVFVNDLIDLVEEHGVQCSVYADDTKIYLPIRNSSDHARLQQAVSAVDSWCIANGMLLNAGKCSTITFSMRHRRSTYAYHVKGEEIKRTECVKDLGVWLDCELRMNHHIDKTVSSARRVLGLIKRICKELGNDIWLARSLYMTLVRPILEYASNSWSPHCTTKMARIESVQKQFLLWALKNKYPLNIFPYPPYQQRLAELRMDSIAHRHQLSLIMLAYDCIHGNVDCHSITSRFIRNDSSRLTRHRLFFRPEMHRTDYGKFNPINKAILLFNPVADLLHDNRTKASFRAAVLRRFRGS